MEREEGRIIDPIIIEPTASPLGADIIIHHRGLTYRYHTDEWNPKTVQTTAWNMLKDLMLGGKGDGKK